MRIISPSYKRAKTCKTHIIIPNIEYAVHEFEAQKYIDEGLNVVVLPDSLRGNLSRVRNYIKKNYLKDFGYMIDDDIEAFKRWDFLNNNFVLKTLSPSEVLELLEYMKMMGEQLEVKLVGMNIIGDKGSYREYTPFSFTNYISASLMGIFKNNLEFDENLPLKEDYDYTLQMLNKYRKTLRFNFCHMVKKDHANVGGCADVRTVKYEKEQMFLFQKKWGGSIVKFDAHDPNDINPIIKPPIKGI